MPKGIKKSEWDVIHQLALDVTNAVMEDNDILAQENKKKLLDSLYNLNNKYSNNPSILATIADFSDDIEYRKKLYEKALRIAKEQDNKFEIREISESLEDMFKDI